MSAHRPTSKGAFAALALGALGVVYGDIGTSPLYALRESLAGEHDLIVDEANVLGVLSLMFWSLIVVVTLKYLVIVMRADNDGEGGILALAALVTGPVRQKRFLLMLGLFGTALLYGDGMITPAISVLSAVEGVGVAAPSVNDFVIPITIAILVGLFSIQRRGTDVIGRFFGPVMIVWFTVLAVLGAVHLLDEPSVLRALSPLHGAVFFADNGLRGFLVLGSVFLVVTGGEALYADMGHFGRSPIQAGWFAIVLPALMLNYLGQGALLLSEPSSIENPFFLLAPRWAQWPLTGLATCATVIASQALISGAFSLTTQAINFGYLPNMHTVQTSEQQQGQVYVPAVNWMLLVACLVLVVTFRSSTALAAAYGVAVTLTMVITTLLIGSVAIHRWHWKTSTTLLVLAPLLVIDCAFALANLFKIPAGGWVPLVVGLAGFTLFTTWKKGRELLGKRISRAAVPVSSFVAELQKHPPVRHPGTGVYLHRKTEVVPPALLANMRFNEHLHETVVLLSVVVENRPHVLSARREVVRHHPLGFHEVEMHYGFTDEPLVGPDLERLLVDGMSFDTAHTTFFLGRERIDVTGRPGMAQWREHLFAYLSRNAGDVSTRFALPHDRCVDIGVHIDI